MHWAGADWRVLTPLLEQGLLPNIHTLLEQGSMGELRAVMPLVPFLLENTLMTGHYAFEHGITQPQQNQRQVPALWDILDNQQLASYHIGWPNTHGLTPNNTISEYFGHPFFLKQGFDQDYLDYWLAVEEVSPDIFSFLVPEWQKIEQHFDNRLSFISHQLAQLFSLHALLTYFLAEKDWQCLSINYPNLSQLQQAFLAYHPPKLEPISEQDFFIYQHVVTSTYRLYDSFLGRILALIDDNTTIYLSSAYGYHTERLK